MRDGITPIEYYEGIFDSYKKQNNLDWWVDFPETMWGLGFEMDAYDSYDEYVKTTEFNLDDAPEMHSEKECILYLLNLADKQVVGNFLFSRWRFLTHWTNGYTKEEVEFLQEILEVLEKKYSESGLI